MIKDNLPKGMVYVAPMGTIIDSIVTLENEIVEHKKLINELLKKLEKKG